MSANQIRDGTEVYFKIQRIKVRDFAVIRHDIHTGAARGFRDGSGEVPNVLGLRYQRNKVATGGLYASTNCRPRARGAARWRGAFKIKDFAFFVFIAGLKVNFFSAAPFREGRRPHKGRYAGNAKEP